MRWLEAHTKVMLLGRLSDFGRRQLLGSAELLRRSWRSGVKVQVSLGEAPWM